MSDLSPERRAAVEEEVSRLNTRAVVQRLEDFQAQIHELRQRVEQGNNNIFADDVLVRNQVSVISNNSGGLIVAPQSTFGIPFIG